MTYLISVQMLTKTRLYSLRITPRKWSPMEARLYSRHTLRAERPCGSFHLRASGELIKLVGIADLSLSGTRVLVHKPLQLGTAVSLTYTSHGCHVEVNGQVMWCDCEASALKSPVTTFRAGIAFKSFDFDNTQLMFLALRAHLDPFARVAVS